MNKIITQGKECNQPTKPLRVFLAITFPQDIIKSLTQVMKCIQASLATKAVRWEKIENLHVTLRFIGNMDPKILEQLSANVQAQLERIDPFTMMIREAILFPSSRKPRVIAMKIEPLDKFRSLADALDHAVVSVGFAKADHPFNGHLTIARIKSRRTVEIELPEVRIHDNHNHLIGINVNYIELISSITKPEGAEYSRLARYKL